jgi:hypothetical protein
VQNAGTGSAPSYFNPLGGIIAILLLPYTCLAFIIGAALQLGTFLVDLGMKVVTSLLTTAATVVKAVVDTAVDVMKKFVDWAIAFINSIITAMLSPLVDSISRGFESYGASVSTSSKALESEARTKGTISPASVNLIVNSIKGEFYWIIVGVVIVISALIAMAEVVTNVFGFLVSVVIGLIGMYIIQNCFNSLLNDVYDKGLPTSVGASPYQTWLIQNTNTSYGTQAWLTLNSGWLFFTALMNLFEYRYWTGSGILVKAASASNLVCSIISYVLGLWSHLFNDQLIGQISNFISITTLGIGIILFIGFADFSALSKATFALNVFFSGTGIFLGKVVP